MLILFDSGSGFELILHEQSPVFVPRKTSVQKRLSHYITSKLPMTNTISLKQASVIFKFDQAISRVIEV
jgi:hypothetical protein